MKASSPSSYQNSARVSHGVPCKKSSIEPCKRPSIKPSATIQASTTHGCALMCPDVPWFFAPMDIHGSPSARVHAHGRFGRCVRGFFEVKDAGKFASTWELHRAMEQVLEAEAPSCSTLFQAAAPPPPRKRERGNHLGFELLVFFFLCVFFCWGGSFSHFFPQLKAFWGSIGLSMGGRRGGLGAAFRGSEGDAVPGGSEAGDTISG